ncbi:MAG: hypothetical protein CVU05_10925 [Bacteroidetes bacterium HGW-Bacteroidetes-21]|jgi:hypothetical protein|nr:MAG: hypothetical protein CVU05_10925 [Bacteroidetes bacterium HGW-Bacteroidetes-21]
MNMENYKDFRFQKERDFSDLFTDIFVFLKNNYKRLFYLLLLYAGPFFLIDGIVSAYFQNYVYSFSTMNPYSIHEMYGGPFAFLSKFLVWYGAIMLFKVLGYTFISSITYAYISLYAQKGPQFDINEVRPLAFSYFFPFLLASILISIVIVIGTIFCIIPGIYLGICLSFIFIIMIWERKGIGEAFGRCFNVAHKDFWWTLLILLVISVAIGIVAFIIALPMTAISFFGVFTRMSSGDVNSYYFIINVIVSSITNVVVSLLSSVTMVAIALQYFNIVEKEKKSQPDQSPSQTVNL